MVRSVQYLRGVAACMVLLEHIAVKSAQHSTNTLSSWHVGSAGVDLFFLISGFIMCHTMAEKHRQPYAGVTFFWRRILRIMPLYWFVTGIALVAYLAMPGQVNSSGGSTDIISSFLLLPTSGVYLVANGWTLCYEFLFYALFTFGLLFSRSVGSLLVVVALSSMAIFGFLQPQDGVWSAFLTNQLLLEFAVGIGLCYYLPLIKKLPLIVMPMLIGVGVGALIAVNQGIHTDIRVIDLGLPMAFIMVGALGLERELQTRPSQLLNLLGDSSYAMYLIHPFILVAGTMILNKLGLTAVMGGWFFVLVLFLASTVAGWVLFKYIEVPMGLFIKKQLGKVSNRRLQTNVVRAVDG